MADYADWTESIELLGTEIQVPIDIQGAFIQMPIDIQGQYITLEMDIVAQSVGNIGIDIKAQTIGNISVNIAASAVTMNVAIQSSAVTLNVNISSQTANINVNIAAQAGNVTINVAAQSVGVYLQPEWAAKSGIDKDFQGEADFAAGAANTYTVYTVPANKAFFVNQVGLIDLLNTSNQTFAPPLSLSLAAYNGDTYYWKAGASGAGGGVSNLVKPAYFAAGLQVRVRLANPSSIAARLCYFISGYEVSV